MDQDFESYQSYLTKSLVFLVFHRSRLCDTNFPQDFRELPFWPINQRNFHHPQEMDPNHSRKDSVMVIFDGLNLLWASPPIITDFSNHHYQRINQVCL